MKSEIEVESHKVSQTFQFETPVKKIKLHRQEMIRQSNRFLTLSPQAQKDIIAEFLQSHYYQMSLAETDASLGSQFLQFLAEEVKQISEKKFEDNVLESRPFKKRTSFSERSPGRQNHRYLVEEGYEVDEMNEVTIDDIDHSPILCESIKAYLQNVQEQNIDLKTTTKAKCPKRMQLSQQCFFPLSTEFRDNSQQKRQLVTQNNETIEIRWSARNLNIKIYQFGDLWNILKASIAVDPKLKSQKVEVRNKSGCCFFARKKTITLDSKQREEKQVLLGLAKQELSDDNEVHISMLLALQQYQEEQQSVCSQFNLHHQRLYSQTSIKYETKESGIFGILQIIALHDLYPDQFYKYMNLLDTTQSISFYQLILIISKKIIDLLENNQLDEQIHKRKFCLNTINMMTVCILYNLVESSLQRKSCNLEYFESMIHLLDQNANSKLEKWIKNFETFLRTQ